MTTTLFDIVLTGELLEGATPPAAIEALANLFKISIERAQQLFDAAPKVVKAGLDADTAKKYQLAIEKAGLKVEVRPVVDDMQTTTTMPDPVPAVALETKSIPPQNERMEIAPTQFQGLHFNVEGRPDFSFLTVQLPVNQMLKVEASAMATMDTNLVMKTKLKGGFSRLLSGESIFMNEFTAQAGAGEIGIAPAAPGDLVHHYLKGETLFLQNSALVACTPGVTIETKWQGFTKGFFSGENLFLIRATGEGDLWFNSYGAIIEIDVTDGYVVDTGNIVAFTEGLEYSISKVGGYKSLFFSGEGFVCRFTGHGKLWIQTRSAGAFTGWAQFYRPVKSSG